MGWGRIRVWNDDRIAAKTGFPPHPHRDMEIVTYVRTGAVTHQDSMGNKGRTAAGDVQVMSAGTGVRHAEYNLEDEATTLFQIWVLTDKRNAEPSWGAKQFPKGDRAGSFVTLASGFENDADALKINAAARVLGATLKAGEEAELQLQLLDLPGEPFGREQVLADRPSPARLDDFGRGGGQHEPEPRTPVGREGLCHVPERIPEDARKPRRLEARRDRRGLIYRRLQERGIGSECARYWLSPPPCRWRPACGSSPTPSRRGLPRRQ